MILALGYSRLQEVLGSIPSQAQNDFWFLFAFFMLVTMVVSEDIGKVYTEHARCEAAAGSAKPREARKDKSTMEPTG